MSEERFISKDKPFADVFVVVDNTGWLQAAKGSRGGASGTVTF